MKRYLPPIFAIIALLFPGSQLAFSQAANPVSQQDLIRIAKVKDDLEDIGVGKTITVSRLDNRDFFGRVKQIGTDDFEIVDSDTKIVHIFKYVDIKNVRSGDGQRGYISGKRKNPRSSKYILLGVAGGLIGFVIFVGKSLK